MILWLLHDYITQQSKLTLKMHFFPFVVLIVFEVIMFVAHGLALSVGIPGNILLYQIQIQLFLCTGIEQYKPILVTFKLVCPCVQPCGHKIHHIDPPWYLDCLNWLDSGFCGHLKASNLAAFILQHSYISFGPSWRLLIPLYMVHM